MENDYKITIPAGQYDRYVASDDTGKIREAYLRGNRSHWLGGVTWYGNKDDFRFLNMALGNLNSYGTVEITHN